MDNEQFIVSARKYRPQDFHSVIGQSSLTATLKNAILTNHLAHAYLFYGPRGVGKTTCARIFAKTINCFHLTENGEACNECESCRSFNEQRSMNIFEIDAASNTSVDDIRDLVSRVYIPPQIGKYSIYIVDEVHMLSKPAFNAFLKTLEEPPKYAVFILATTEKHKILPTIISRCQIYDFKRIEVTDTVEYLRYVAKNENITAADEALNVIAQKADGAMRDALSIFDQVVSFCGKNITYQAVIENLNVLDYEYYFKLTDKFLTGDAVNSLLIFNEVLNKGFDAQNFMSGLASHFRDILMSRDKATLPLLQVGETIAKQYYEQAIRCPQQFLYKALDIANTCDLNYRTSQNKRLLVELTLIKLCQILTAEEEKREIAVKKIEQPAAQPTEQHAENAVEPQKPTIPNINNLNQNSPFTAILNPQKETPQPQQTIVNEPVVEENIVENENADFTEEQLSDAWKKYGKTITDTFQANYVNSVAPKIEDGFCSVLVPNQTYFNALSAKKSEIESFLRNTLKNREIQLKIAKDEEIKQKIVLSPEDRLQEMKRENPLLQDLISEIGLEIKY
ncbi:MAG: DNA polymerase III subunit gamma/tau [Prevotellaceae bacterium]|jgi:DNA polymerase-3 subunit gamma/tau|nr:DNA polymerase III subunit gamma/tau [Prevotellaceae bacterium]